MPSTVRLIRFACSSLLLLLLCTLIPSSQIHAAAGGSRRAAAVPLTVNRGNAHLYNVRVLATHTGQDIVIDIESLARAFRLGLRRTRSGLVLEENLGSAPTLCSVIEGNNFIRIASRTQEQPLRIIQLQSAPMLQKNSFWLPVDQACRLFSLWLNHPVRYDRISGRIRADMAPGAVNGTDGNLGLLNGPAAPAISRDERRTDLSVTPVQLRTVITGVEVAKKANGAIISFSASGPPSAGTVNGPDGTGTTLFSLDKATCDTGNLMRLYKTGMVRSISARQAAGNTLQFSIVLDNNSFAINSVELQYNKRQNSYDLYIRSDVDVEEIRRKEKEKQIARVLNRDMAKWKFDTVILDAGHGGKDPGAVGYEGTREKDVALNIVRDLGAFIEQRWPDVQVIYTRRDDTFIPLHERGKVANRNGGKLFLSVHCNASVNRTARGAEVYILGIHKNKAALDVAMMENAVIRNEADYQTEYKNFSDEYLIMSSMAQNAFTRQSTDLAQDLLRPFEGKQATRGVRQAGFMVLWTPSMPSALVEVGYLSNPAEERILRDRQEQTRIAYGLFKGLQSYRKNYESTVLSSLN